jgi:hypothetical protein
MESIHEKAFAAVRTGDLQALAELLIANPSLAAARDANGVSLRLQACYQHKSDMLEMLRDAAPPLDIFEAAALPGAAERGAELLAADPGLANACGQSIWPPRWGTRMWRKCSAATGTGS